MFNLSFNAFWQQRGLIALKNEHWFIEPGSSDEIRSHMNDDIPHVMQTSSSYGSSPEMSNQKRCVAGSKAYSQMNSFSKNEKL